MQTAFLAKHKDYQLKTLLDSLASTNADTESTSYSLAIIGQQQFTPQALIVSNVFMPVGMKPDLVIRTAFSMST